MANKQELGNHRRVATAIQETYEEFFRGQRSKSLLYQPGENERTSYFLPPKGKLSRFKKDYRSQPLGSFRFAQRSGEDEGDNDYDSKNGDDDEDFDDEEDEDNDDIEENDEEEDEEDEDEESEDEKDD